jgi:hypothetical protein
MKQTTHSKLSVPGPFIPQLQHRLYLTQNQCFNVNQLITIIVQILRLYNLLKLQHTYNQLLASRGHHNRASYIANKLYVFIH